MIWLILTGDAAYLAVYFAIGWKLAIRDIPNARHRAAAEYDRDYYADLADFSVKEQTICTVLFWPIAIPLRRFSSKLDRTIAHHDPVKLQAQISERDQRIAELERELGIGQRSGQ